MDRVANETNRHWAHVLGEMIAYFQSKDRKRAPPQLTLDELRSAMGGAAGHLVSSEPPR